MHRECDRASIRRDRNVAVATRGNRRDIVIQRRQIRGLPTRDVHQENMLALPRAPIVPMAPHEVRPESRVGRILPVPLIDLLRRRPLDVARDQQPLPIRHPQRIRGALGQTRDLPRIAASDRQQPDLRAAFARRDEGERLPIRRPARLAIRCRTTGERSRFPRRHFRDPHARDVAIVLQRGSRHRVRDPFAVR